MRTGKTRKKNNMDYIINLPSQPRVVTEEENKGVYEIDGLYAGYGHTLGNSLRRIILSSLPGTAITSIKIEGVPHEFSNIDGIKEDVITILLNLKRVKFQLHTDEPQKIKLVSKGVGRVTAKDFEKSSQAEVLNGDQEIANLTSKDAKLEMEVTVEKGLGYVTKEALHKDKAEIGIIISDAVFTPVRKVNYEVENMRVGERTDYNRLRFSIETDGTISPRESLEKSIEIMINHLRSIVGFKEEEEIVEIDEEIKEAAENEEEEKAEVDDKDVLKTRIDDLQLSPRTMGALSEAGIRTVGGLVRKKESDLLKVEGLGKKSAQEIKRALGNLGLILK